MLSKEEIEKAKEIMNKFMNNEMQRDKLEKDCRCGGWKIGDIYKHLELNPSIRILLQYIEELEADNYELNNRLNEYIEDNNKQNKIIDKMADIISRLDFTINGVAFGGQSRFGSNEEIKQYFEKEVEGK